MFTQNKRNAGSLGSVQNFQDRVLLVTVGAGLFLPPDALPVSQLKDVKTAVKALEGEG